MKIIESIYVISQLKMFGGQEIEQGRGELLPKVSAKFCENFGSSKFH